MSIPRYAITQSHAAQEDPRCGGWVLHSDHEAEVERLGMAWNEASANKHRLLKEVRALEAEAERLTAERDGLRSCWASLTQLVALKDGPRDDIYYSERESAWAGARAALAALPTPPEEDDT